MNLQNMTVDELIQILRDAVETRNGKTIQAVKDEYNRRSKYDE